MSNDALKQIWTDWKNVILITTGVVITVSSLWWLPPVVSLFESDPARITSTSKQVSDLLWFVIFIFAAQMIFSNRRKRQEMKKQQEEAQKEAANIIEAEDDMDERS